MSFFILTFLIASGARCQTVFTANEEKKALLPLGHYPLFFSIPTFIIVLPFQNQHVNKPINLHTKPQKLAFFCKMEDNFRNKFNVYLKLRAGNDEEYRKMFDGKLK